MTEMITIPKWLFELLCKQAGPIGEKTVKGDVCFCGNCGVREGGSHQPGCPWARENDDDCRAWS